MGKKKFVTSTINLRRQKELIIEDMHKKLASGSEAVLTHVKRSAQRKLQLVLSYLVCVVMVTSTAVISLLQWKRHRAAPKRVVCLYVEPVALMDRSLAAGEITLDEYAKHLCNLLVNYDQVPEKYRSGVPQLSAERVYVVLDSVWGDLHPGTRTLLERSLSRLRRPAVDLNGDLISEIQESE